MRSVTGLLGLLCVVPAAVADVPLFVSIEDLDSAVYAFGADLGPLGVFGQVNDMDSPLMQGRSVTFGPDGHLYVGSRNGNAVLKYAGDDGTFLGEFVGAGSGGLAGPRLTFGPDGNLYLTHLGGENVLQYDGVTGAFMDVFASNADSPLRGGRGLTFSPVSGNLLVTCSNRRCSNVLEYDGSTGAFVGVFADEGALTRPADLAFGPNGNLFVTSAAGALANRVVEYEGTSGTLIGVFGEASFDDSGLVRAQGIVFPGDGFMYVTSRDTDQVIQFHGITGDFTGTVAGGGLVMPFDVTSRGNACGEDIKLEVECDDNGATLELEIDGADEAAIVVLVVDQGLAHVMVELDEDGEAETTIFGLPEGNHTVSVCGVAESCADPDDVHDDEDDDEDDEDEDEDDDDD